MLPRTLQLLVLFLLCSCIRQSGKTLEVVETKVYAEKYRPQYHFSPPTGWMNDPNGLVYHDGLYHLFYQYYPHATVWGPMHWGHAVSSDLINWDNKPIALYPDKNGFIFSGSAVVDKNNTSGFGTHGKIPLVAIFTYHDMEGEKSGRSDFQTQGIAFSLDNGETWEKYEGNPVIGNVDTKDLRDPKVFWHEGTESWIMALVAGDHAKFYRSKNLKEWDNISDFGQNQGAHGGVWECPDLFPLKVEGTDEEKWVLIISIGNGAPNGGSGTQYFVGDFDGTTFSSEQKEYKWLDWGTDNYAGVTYNDTPDGQRKFIGWMSNWQYALKTPTSTWRSAMTLPRNLGLKKIEGEYVLVNYPVQAINAIISDTSTESFELEASEKKIWANTTLSQSKVSLSLPKKDFVVSFSNDGGEEFRLIFDSASNLVMLDRTTAGQDDFNYQFGNKLHYMILDDKTSESMKLEFFIDNASCELFINDGENVMTSQFFPSEGFSKFSIENMADETIVVSDFAIAEVKGIWK
ncbi:glycoside hydrolase family 32 protein [Croceivirga thetidis]|uniref:Glycoside hydrolase family 32 protein n=1 Tax=Croceivirga thetidis TaxID=2721623 RepID=A0ABX1GP19_9FLAO|nr:glycoside hydrolase family 32 protein [Croceivirga thetidis]NKI31673.1 glycoside hydrolase family 32 protein [Croceivirga thetidis]